MATLASPTGTTPTRWATATFRSGQRRAASTPSARISRSAMAVNASYSRRTTRRPAFSLRVVPRKVTTAPARGAATARTSRARSIGTSVTRNMAAPGSEHELHGVRLDLRRARSAAPLADVFVLLALPQHEQEPLAHGHRLATTRTVEQARLQ